MRKLTVLTLILSTLGAINVGFWGCFQFDFVAFAFHSNTSWGARSVYALVGLSAVWSLRFYWFVKIKQVFCKEIVN